MIRRLLRSDRRGSTAVEFALVGMLLSLVTFGVIETALLWWLKSGLQLTASLTARCGAMGYTYNTSGFSCTNTSTTQNFAVTAAQTWLMANMVTAANVTVNGKVSSCNGFAGNFFSVTVGSSFFTAFPPPLGNYTLSANACFPMQ